jgi:hypothetical protein
VENAKNLVIGGIITLIIGGLTYSFSRQDLIDNFTADTGLSQQQAEEFISSKLDEEGSSWEELGHEFSLASQSLQKIHNSIDCENLSSEEFLIIKEGVSLSCDEALEQIAQIANSAESVSVAYLKLSEDNVSRDDVRETVFYLDQFITDLDSPVLVPFISSSTIEDYKLSSSLNKSLLKTALEN